MSRIAIVAALEREVRPLAKRWRVVEKEHAGRGFRFFESNDRVLVCGGMGAEAARRAAEAVIALYAPVMIYSAGFAGALDTTLKVGDVLKPARIVDAGNGSSVNLEGKGVLVSFGSVASSEQKAKLRASFGAQAVDMEAAAVRCAAEARGLPFGAVKVISDEFDFSFPPMQRFVDSQGRFHEGQFACFAALRPWLWPRLVRLARNSRLASRALCDSFGNLVVHQVPAAPAVNDR